jgi:perosamine synthetase
MSVSSEGKSLQHSDYGDIHTFSFSPHKIVSTGQGGAVLTDDDELAKTVKRLKDFGRLEGGADVHDFFGTNCKFTDLQAVVGLAQIGKLVKRMAFKMRLYDRYHEKLKGTDNLCMYDRHPYHTPWFTDIYVCDGREDLISFLKRNGIGTRKMYPCIHSQKCYMQGYGNFPVSVSSANTGVWLPSSFDLTNEQVDYICMKIQEFYGKK